MCHYCLGTQVSHIFLSLKSRCCRNWQHLAAPVSQVAVCHDATAAHVPIAEEPGRTLQSGSQKHGKHWGNDGALILSPGVRCVCDECQEANQSICNDPEEQTEVGQLHLQGRSQVSNEDFPLSCRFLWDNTHRRVLSHRVCFMGNTGTRKGLWEVRL